MSYLSYFQGEKEIMRTQEHFTGCLLGGAVGDALGDPVEFHSIDLIRKKYGSAGIADYDVAYGRRGAITDDTQMTLFEDTDAWRHRYPGH
jgi:ADP-ribosylglycohydrolase